MNVNEYWLKSTLIQKLIYIIYIICFIIATSTHIMSIISNGFIPNFNKPLWVKIYWTSLTFADPLAILLLLMSVKKGLILYAIIIISDVIINLYFTIVDAGFIGIINIFMLGQLFFLFFLMITWNKIQKGIITKEKSKLSKNYVKKTKHN